MTTFLIIRTQRLQEFDFGRIAVQLVGRLEVEGQVAQGRVIDDTRERLKADVPLADLGVTILVTAERVEAIVEVDGTEPVESDHTIKVGEDIVEMMDNVVAAVEDVARVEADAKMIA